MIDYKKMLEAAEEAAKVVQDPELRKIAFQEVLKHELSGAKEHKSPTDKAKTAPQSNPSGKTKGKRKRATGVRPEVKSLDMSPAEKGLPSWKDLSMDYLKFLWVLEAARLKKVEALTSSEISHLIEAVFRQHFRPKVINNLKKKVPDRLVRVVSVDMDGKNVDAWKILDDGTREVNKPPATDKAK
jgi:hypothetical protein